MQYCIITYIRQILSDIFAKIVTILQNTIRQKLRE